MNLLKKLALTGAILITLAKCEPVPQKSTEYTNTYFQEEGIVTEKYTYGGREGIRIRYMITFKIGDSEVKWIDALEEAYNPLNKGDSVIITFEKNTRTDYYHYHGKYKIKSESSTNCEVKNAQKK